MEMNPYTEKYLQKARRHLADYFHAEAEVAAYLEAGDMPNYSMRRRDAYVYACGASQCFRRAEYYITVYDYQVMRQHNFRRYDRGVNYPS